MKTTNKKILTGSQTVAEVIRQLDVDVVPIYPITPQTQMIEAVASMAADGSFSGEVVRAETEHSVMSLAVGASIAGARVITASASQGIALMWEVLGVASGLRLPIVMAVGNRAISSPLNIHCDHSDSMGTRDLGWIQIACENVQEVYDHLLLATKVAEDREIQLPAMILLDGFVTTHCLENLTTLSDDTVEGFIGKRFVEKSALDVDHPSTWGSLVLPDHYMDFRISQHEDMEQAKTKFLRMGEQLSALTDRAYSLFELYEGEIVSELKDTDTVLVFMNSTAGTAKEAVDRLRQAGRRVALLKPILFRPFPYNEIRAALTDVRRVIVYDRSMSYGAQAPLVSEIRNALYGLDNAPEVISRIYGLGGKDVTVEEIVRSV